MILEERITVLDSTAVGTFVPRRETIVLRVFDTTPPYCLKNKEKYPLPEHPWIIKPVLEYSFDDLSYKDVGSSGIQDEEDKQNQFAFNIQTAEQVLSDFNKTLNREPRADIVCSCFRGESRSAALAISLSQIFGFEVPNLGFRYPRYNELVYDIMIKTAGNMGLA